MDDNLDFGDSTEVTIPTDQLALGTTVVVAADGLVYQVSQFYTDF